MLTREHLLWKQIPMAELRKQPTPPRQLSGDINVRASPLPPEKKNMEGWGYERIRPFTQPKTPFGTNYRFGVCHLHYHKKQLKKTLMSAHFHFLWVVRMPDLLLLCRWSYGWEESQVTKKLMFLRACIYTAKICEIHASI